MVHFGIQHKSMPIWPGCTAARQVAIHVAHPTVFQQPAVPASTARRLRLPLPPPFPLIQSPLSALLAPAQREATADVVNAALLCSRVPAGAAEPQAGAGC